MPIIGTSETVQYINTDIVQQLGTFVTTIFGWVTSNPLFMVFLTVSLIGLGFGIVRKLKGVVTG